MAVLLNQEEIKKRLINTNGWALVGEAIQKEFSFKGFAEALRFVNRVGELAEGMDHHPDMTLHAYKKVKLTLTTHDARTADGQKASGLTRIDFDLADRIENALRKLDGS
ncbi:MAG TPA: 4a-hydroxytetrahydrobiopterin dehydratase [bacterium]|nr:4a-hydroxytetrahydrobiopterin dehydratase [bacterium]